MDSAGGRDHYYYYCSGGQTLVCYETPFIITIITIALGGKHLSAGGRDHYYYYCCGMQTLETPFIRSEFLKY